MLFGRFVVRYTRNARYGPFMPFLPHKLYAQPKNAALPELCLLGKKMAMGKIP